MNDDAFSGGSFRFPAEHYGYVIWAAALTFVVNFVQTVVIGQARKKEGVDYPIMYSETSQKFNCAQRVHQNTLEQLPFFLVNLFSGGLRHPISAAVFGAVFLVARIIYGVGYWSGKPARRVPGSVMTLFFAQIPLFCLAVSAGAGFVGLW